MRDDGPSRPVLTPEVYARFAAYYAEHPTWGSLHVVMDDGNLETVHVRWTVGWAEEHGDTEGAALARLLLSYTKTQRGRIAKRVMYPDAKGSR